MAQQIRNLTIEGTDVRFISAYHLITPWELHQGLRPQRTMLERHGALVKLISPEARGIRFRTLDELKAFLDKRGLRGIISPRRKGLLERWTVIGVDDAGWRYRFTVLGGADDVWLFDFPPSRPVPPREGERGHS